MFSPDAWSCYTDPLLQRLRSLGVGFHLGGLFMGAFLYSDDQLLIAPNRRAMELMLQEVERFALDSNIHFSTDPDPSKSKSKLICTCVGARSHLFPLLRTWDTRSMSLVK